MDKTVTTTIDEERYNGCGLVGVGILSMGIQAFCINFNTLMLNPGISLVD